MRTWREVINFASQTFRVTPAVGESARKHKSKVSTDQSKEKYLLGKRSNSTVF